MIPRYQALLFAILLTASTIMAVALWQMRDHAHQQLLTGEDTSPTKAPAVDPVVEATLVVANDANGGLQSQRHTLPLPSDPGSKARALLDRLFELYSAPNSTHPLQGGSGAILQVFLMPLPKAQPAPAPTSSNPAQSQPTNPLRPPAPTQGLAQPASQQLVSSTQTTDTDRPMLAVVNLSGSFASAHPAGIEAESLTLLSICGTLHANLPQVAQVRFLVDGQPRPTLAGHADLSRLYLTGELPTPTGVQP